MPTLQNQESEAEIRRLQEEIKTLKADIAAIEKHSF